MPAYTTPLKTALVAGAIALLLGGCASVAPYQRGTLASYGMRTDRDPLTDRVNEHIYFSREAASGGASIGGGGCGCN